MPASWTEGRIKLRAKIFPEDVVYMQDGECGSPACTPNNAQTLAHVLFEPMPTVTVTPVLMSFSGAPGGLFPGTPKTIFKQARYFSPSPLVWFNATDSAYAGQIDIQNEVNANQGNAATCGALLDKLEDSFLTLTPLGNVPGILHGNSTVGVFASGAGCGGTSEPSVHLPADGESFSVVNASRPATSVAHELFHGFGRVHADTTCGGNSNNQIRKSGTHRRKVRLSWSRRLTTATKGIIARPPSRGWHLPR